MYVLTGIVVQDQGGHGQSARRDQDFGEVDQGCVEGQGEHGGHGQRPQQGAAQGASGQLRSGCLSASLFPFFPFWGRGHVALRGDTAALGGTHTNLDIKTVVM